MTIELLKVGDMKTNNNSIKITESGFSPTVQSKTGENCLNNYFQTTTSAKFSKIDLTKNRTVVIKSNLK